MKIIEFLGFFEGFSGDGWGGRRRKRRT